MSDNPGSQAIQNLNVTASNARAAAENNLKAEIAKLRQARIDLQRQLDAVLTSKAWRWTARLRSASNPLDDLVPTEGGRSAHGAAPLHSDGATLPEVATALRKDNARLQAQLDMALASKSWRVTAPLRVAMQLGRGDWRAACASIEAELIFYYRMLPRAFREQVAVRRARLMRAYRSIGNSSMNLPALQAIVDHRCAFVKDFSVNPKVLSAPAEWPFIDITVVCYNSRKWLDGFARSLADQAYPLDRIHLYFIDHGSTDGTVSALERLQAETGAAFAGFKILTQSNRGFGAGHNTGIRASQSPYCLVTNADLTFDRNALTRVVTAACADGPHVACWELRQKPYEHPKFYDPVTGETNWCAHACVLLRRSAFEAVGGYDENIFMYGEDVELSYRLRRDGFRLRYCPEAVVWHFTYEHENQVKPLQYTGSIFANLYLRLKYGTWADIAVIPVLMAKVFKAPEVYAGSRRDLRTVFRRLIALLPQALRTREKSTVSFPFYQWDYEVARQGAFVAAEEIRVRPLVSVITRTYKGRETYLLQSMLSVMRQTYPEVEHVIVEDGGTTLEDLVHCVSEVSGSQVNYFSVGKVGRSAAGNAGLAAAKGEFVLFLDDDDLLFADHIEMLVQAIQATPEIAAAYSLAWDVPTDARGLSDGTLSVHAPILHKAMLQPFDPEVLKQYNYIPIQGILFRRKVYLERGGFEEDLEALEDWNLWNRYAVNNWFAYVPKVTSLFRTPADRELARKRAEVLTAAYDAVAKRTAEAVRQLE